MLTRSPLKILLADPDYNQYLMLKQVLQVKCKHYCNLFWYGEHDQYVKAIDSGAFDLAIVGSKLASSALLKTIGASEHHTPVVLIVDQLTRDDAIMASNSGAFGVIDKYQMQGQILANYLACAELFHNGELGEGFLAEVTMLGKHSELQDSYIYIH